ncbi:lipopolysaccharide biosynthesis protein [Blastococcus xanthinilyticus]|uniref:O-antigen/teichoic acid export membrane protein n=1 Tax=Blastococcus xanthinilyticus TaxID=1564164 RepID=A0A5S5CSZ0_9ACTN|nr:hypothetical protein [Blastococcus xanthinilyticus]TYP86234.1 O-antigen/teichoic acid export membrane protein [Blastococcus xanthinilyticus]
MAAPSSNGGPAVRATLPWRRLASFASLPLISLVSSVVIIPVIASVAGAQGWAAVALGQALGAGAATVLQYGWGFTGPTLLAPLGPAERARLLWVSTLSRLMLAVILVPAAAGVAAFLAPDGRVLLAALTTVATATFGLSAFWFFVGTGRAGHAARYETVPRLLAVSGSAALVLATGDPIYYPVVFLAGQVLALGWLTVKLASISFSAQTWSEAFAAFRTQRFAAGSDVVVAVSQSVPTSIVAGVAHDALAVFAAGDRLQKLAQSAIQPLFNAFQGWVSESPRESRASRMKLSVLATSVSGVLVGAVLAIGLPLVDDVLFAGEVEVRYGVAIPVGIALALYSLTSSINFNVLAPAGRTAHIFRSTAAGAGVSVVAVGSLAHEFGAPGGAWAIVLAQLTVLVVQLSGRRRPQRAGAPAPAEVAGGVSVA